MKTKEVSNTINTNPLDVKNLHSLKIFNLPICAAVVMSISLGFVALPVRAENTGTEDIQHYRYVESQGIENTAKKAIPTTKESSAAKDTGAKKTNQGEQTKIHNENTSTATTNLSTKDSSTEKSADAEKTTSGDKNTQINQKTDPVSKPTDGKGALPTFDQADINGDHYITKEELKNFPFLLQVFDKVDAGEDGKLEQHEYQNLEMETKREGEVR